jgi:hypothetical protein
MGTGAQLAVEPRNVATLRRHGGCDPIAAPPIASPPLSQRIGGRSVRRLAKQGGAGTEHAEPDVNQRMRMPTTLPGLRRIRFANLADQ